ncbi:MAG: TldD/PmbA family protein [Bryobacteraceae bacterium]|nr:TldD/PmbA family protein [Bryobacteraceae bacterium]
MNQELQEIAQRVVALARGKGADDAECTISEGQEFSVSVRMGEIETLKEAGSRGAGVRVLIGKRVGSSYTSDLTEEGLRHMVSSAIELAGLTSEDPAAGLPEDADFGTISGDLKLYSAETLPPADRIRLAKECEAAALGADARIVNSEGAGFGAYSGARYFANSRGFSGAYRSSSCSISVMPVAKEGESMERDFWYSIGRDYKGLESAEYVGKKAAERALRRLGSRKAPTQKAPIVFDPRTARSLLGCVFEAIAGDSVYRKATFLVDKLGEKIASENFTVIDDATIPGLFGTQPFDDEGVASRRTVVVEKGVLKSYLLNSYTARKLGMKTTGNASRGITGNPSVGHGNFYLEQGTMTPEQMIRSVRNGFYVTELIGSGINIVTGDYSQGAAGIWIENGELTYPVSEVTIAGNLIEMLNNVEAIASDLEFRGSMASPTILIGEMMVSGK